MNKPFYKIICIVCILSIVLSMFTITSFASDTESSEPSPATVTVEPGLYALQINGTGVVDFGDGYLYVVVNKVSYGVDYIDLNSSTCFLFDPSLSQHIFDPTMQFILKRPYESDSRLIFRPQDFELCNVVLDFPGGYLTRTYPFPSGQDFNYLVTTVYGFSMFRFSSGESYVEGDVIYDSEYDLYHSSSPYDLVEASDSASGTFLTYIPDVDYYSFSVEDLYTGHVTIFTYPSSITDFASFVDSSFNTNDFIVVDEYGNVMVSPNGVTMGSYPLHNSQYLDDPMTSDYEIIDGDTYYYTSFSGEPVDGYYTILPDADFTQLHSDFRGDLYFCNSVSDGSSAYIGNFSLIDSSSAAAQFNYLGFDLQNPPSGSIKVMDNGVWLDEFYRYIHVHFNDGTGSTVTPDVYRFFYDPASEYVSSDFVLDGFYSFSDTPDFATLFDYRDGNYLYYSLTPASMYDRSIRLTFFDRLNNEYNYLVFDSDYQDNDDTPLVWDDLNGWRLSYSQHIHFDSFKTNHLNYVLWLFDSDNGSFVSDDGSSSPGYDPGYDDGYDVGYNEGYDSGYREGHYLGFNSGKEEGYDEGYDVGYNEGYDAGASSGSSPEDVYEAYTRGYETGYLEGENAGMTSSLSSNFFGNFFSGVFDSLDNFKLAEYSILGTTYYITPWSIVTTVAVVMMILWVLKLIAGG